MSHDEITDLTNKVEKYNSDTYDLSYIAQIGWWVKNNGWTGKWPNLEYKGPMFYKLAHTSMSRWQKKAASTILELPEEIDGRCKFDREKGFLWSSVEDMIVKRDKFQNLPDYSTVRHFFELFRDGGGNKGFSTRGIKNSLMGDFWVKCLNKEIKIIDESDVMGDEDNGEENSIEDYKDLL